MLFMALEAHRDLRDRLGSAIDLEAVFEVASEACEREEAACSAAGPGGGAMAERCDRADAPSVTWYRRHRGRQEAQAGAGAGASAGGTSVCA